MADVGGKLKFFIDFRFLLQIKNVEAIEVLALL